MAMDDILAQAFGNINQPQQNFLQGFQDTNQALGKINEANVQIQHYQQELAIHQASIQQQYLAKSADLTLKALDEKTSNKIRPVLLGAASNMSAKGGMGAFSEDFMKAAADSPELQNATAQAAQIYMQLQQDPLNKDKATQFGASIKDLVGMSLDDYPSALRKIQDANKEYGSLLGHALQGQLKVDNSANLDIFKNVLAGASEVNANKFTPKGLSAAPLKDAAGNPILDEKGKPVTLAQAMIRFGAINQPGGAFNPSSTDSQIAQAAMSTISNQKALNADITEKEKVITQTLQDISKVPMSGQPKDVRQDFQWLNKNVAKGINAGNYNQLYAAAVDLNNRALTGRDVVERGRGQADKATEIVKDTNSDISKTSDLVDKLSSAKKVLLAKLNNPNLQTGEIKDVLRIVAGTTDSYNNVMGRFDRSEADRILPITKWQTAVTAAKSILNNAEGAAVTEAQKNILRNALNDAEMGNKSALATIAYDRARQLGSYNQELQPNLAKAKAELERVSTQSTVYQQITTDQLQKLYQAVQSGKDPDYVIHEAAAHGYNPFAVERYFKAQQQAKKKKASQ